MKFLSIVSLGLLLSLPLSACDAPKQQGADSVQNTTSILGLSGLPASACPAKDFQHWIGQAYQDVDQTSLPAKHRVLLPGMPMTRDMRPDRLNILVDDRGVVFRVFCG